MKSLEDYNVHVHQRDQYLDQKVINDRRSQVTWLTQILNDPSHLTEDIKYLLQHAQSILGGQQLKEEGLANGHPPNGNPYMNNVSNARLND